MIPRAGIWSLISPLGAALAFAGQAQGQAPAGATPVTLTALEQRIRSGEIPNIHSVLVVQGGKTLAEWYFKGPDQRRGAPLGVVTFGPETIHDIRSVTKSIVSLLFGLAHSQGAIKDLDTPVLDFFPEYQDLQTAQRRRIRLRDLLSMTSGLHWDERTYPYSDPRNSETAMDRATDRWRYILTQPLDTAPGARFLYSGGDVALIGEVITRATKMPLDEFARVTLFRPLGITQFDWVKDKKGVPFAASGLRLLPRDMMKIGLLMLHHGRAGTRQVVPVAWADAAVTPHALIDREPGCGADYGYFWWLGPACPAISDPGWFAAFGNGGQRIWVVPTRDIVIVITAGLYNDPTQRRVQEIVDNILAAISGTKG